jgi:hypothetical protein
MPQTELSGICDSQRAELTQSMNGKIDVEKQFYNSGNFSSLTGPQRQTWARNFRERLQIIRNDIDKLPATAPECEVAANLIFGNLKSLGESEIADSNLETSELQQERNEAEQEIVKNGKIICNIKLDRVEEIFNSIAQRATEQRKEISQDPYRQLLLNFDTSITNLQDIIVAKVKELRSNLPATCELDTHDLFVQLDVITAKTSEYADEVAKMSAPIKKTAETTENEPLALLHTIATSVMSATLAKLPDSVAEILRYSTLLIDIIEETTEMAIVARTSAEDIQKEVQTILEKLIVLSIGRKIHNQKISIRELHDKKISIEDAWRSLVAVPSPVFDMSPILSGDIEYLHLLLTDRNPSYIRIISERNMVITNPDDISGTWSGVLTLLTVERLQAAGEKLGLSKIVSTSHTRDTRKSDLYDEWVHIRSMFLNHVKINAYFMPIAISENLAKPLVDLGTHHYTTQKDAKDTEDTEENIAIPFFDSEYLSPEEAYMAELEILEDEAKRNSELNDPLRKAEHEPYIILEDKAKRNSELNDPLRKAEHEPCIICEEFTAKRFKAFQKSPEETHNVDYGEGVILSNRSITEQAARDDMQVEYPNAILDKYTDVELAAAFTAIQKENVEATTIDSACRRCQSKHSSDKKPVKLSLKGSKEYSLARHGQVMAEAHTNLTYKVATNLHVAREKRRVKASTMKKPSLPVKKKTTGKSCSIL